MRRGLQALVSRTAVHHVLVAGIGVLAGVAVGALAQQEAKWIGLVAAVAVGMLIVAVTPDRHRLLVATFVTSLQIDVYLRFFYGRANSDGLAVPLVVVAGAAVLLWYASHGRLHEFRWGGSARIPIAAVLGTMLPASITTPEPFVSITAIWAALQLYFVYWLAYNLVDSRAAFATLVRLLLYTLLAQSLVYFVQSALGVTFNVLGETIEEGAIPRPGGTVSVNPAGFTSFVMPALMMAYAAAVAVDPPLPRRRIVVLTGMGIAAIGLSYTRAAWIGLAMAVALVLLLGIRQRRVLPRAGLATLAVAALGAAMLYPTLMARVAADYASGGSDPTDATLDERFLLIRIALNVIQSHPLIGVGPGAYAHVFKGYTGDIEAHWLFTVHNEFLLRAAETGIPGALAFVALLVVAVRTALRLVRADATLLGTAALGWVGALAALVWQMNWVPWSGFAYNAMFWLVLGLMDGADRLVAGERAVAAPARPDRARSH